MVKPKGKGKEKAVVGFAMNYFKLLLMVKGPMSSPDHKADFIDEAWKHACEVNNYQKKMMDDIQ